MSEPVTAGDQLLDGQHRLGHAASLRARSPGYPDDRVLPGSDRPIEIAPSVLPADFAKLGEEVAALEAAGVDRIQWDVMDGQFVPNLTFGPDVIAACRPAHVGAVRGPPHGRGRPTTLAAEYVEAGCGLLIVHAEACRHLHRTLGHIRSLGAPPPCALNPATPASAVAHVLDLVDMVLVMTVNPGFGGQEYIAHHGAEDRRDPRR